jgi:hypothetical protein
METRSGRFHLVLIPGFGGFDAIGQVKYYSGVTGLFYDWRSNHPSPPATLHYFDNFPTAAVTTRAHRLREYLAKRVVRGEIGPEDKLALIGHSTGGLDIRRLVWDLHRSNDRWDYVDGGRYDVEDLRGRIRRALKSVVFLSVPHWGTNIADWVRSYCIVRKAVLIKIQAAIAGSYAYPIDKLESLAAGAAAGLTGAEILLQFADALTEANDHFGPPGPNRLLDSQEAFSELGLYFRHIASDFAVIDDLTACPPVGDFESPAHFSPADRREELRRWNDPPIRVLSYATIGCRPFRFHGGCPAPVWEALNPLAWKEILQEDELTAGTDLSYRACYRACASGPFKRPDELAQTTRFLGPVPPQPIELWDNDGIVNTLSMLWPGGQPSEVVLAQSDHLDIVGHFRLQHAIGNETGDKCREPARRYQSYDVFKSCPRFTEAMFRRVWENVFRFCTGQPSGDQI